MLTSIASAALVSAVASATTSGATSVTTTIGLPEYGAFAVVALVTLLSAKLMLSASTRWNSTIKCSLDMSIIPLLISFTAIIIFKIIAII